MREKIKSLLIQWLADCREIIKQPDVRENVGLFSQNASEIFQNSVMLGMIAWREGDNPTSFLAQAIDDTVMYRDDLISRGMTSSKLPLSTATILASLIDRQSEFALECELDFAGDVFLDCHLGKRLQGLLPNEDIGQGFARLGKLKRQALAARTYRTYFDLIEMDAASTDVPGAIAEAESNFTARRKDAFYSGGPDIEGGGQDNDITVDYRLSAIMKHRGFSSSSIHRWRW